MSSPLSGITCRAMRFAGIVGQSRVTDTLARSLDNHRFSPSLIFHGPSGVGKLTTALALCRNLLCTNGASGPCGACAACRRIDPRALRHPGVRVILPEKLSDFRKGEAWREGAVGIDIQEQQAEAIRNPVWSILIDRVRQARAFLQRYPAEGDYSIVVVDQAHRMGAEAANALLKTIEEPPDHGVMILLTTSLHALLPTIRSRCQTMAFQLVPTQEIAAYLSSTGRFSDDEGGLRASLSGGRIGTALDLDLDAYRTRRAAILAVLDSLIRRGDPGLAVARAEEISRKADSLENDLRILVGLVRDLMILEAAKERPATLVNGDLVRELRPLAMAVGRRGPSLLEKLDSTLDGIRRKGNRQLLVEGFFLALVPGHVHPPRSRVS